MVSSFGKGQTCAGSANSILVSLCAGLLLALATCCAAAAPTTQPLDIRPNPKSQWDAQLADVKKVLNSAASTLWVYFPDKKLAPVLVEPQGGPIVLYRRGPNGEFNVRLATGKTFWLQYSYQFAHEFCHILCGTVEDEPSNKWFEESLCEMASIFALRKMSETWQTSPPYPNWSSYSKALRDYAADRIAKGQLPERMTLARWYLENEKDLRKDPCLREKNTIVAVALLPLFEEQPEQWAAVATLNTSATQRQRTFRQYLSDWLAASPERHRPFIRRIAEKFAITLR